MECQFCKNTLQTKYSLFTHQKTNKKCLVEQQKITNAIIENKLTNCHHCKKSCSKPNLKGHLLVCKQKKQFDIEQEIKKENENKIEEIKKKYEKNLEEIKKKYEKKLEENEKNLEENEKNLEEIKKENEKNLEEIKKKYEKNLEELKKENELLKKELEIKDEIYKDDHKTIRKLAAQPKTTTNNTNNIGGNLNLSDTNRIKNIFEKEFTSNDIMDGQKGLANFAFQNILKDEEGNLVYACVDSSRKMFKFKDIDGKVIKDVNTQKLTDAFIMSDISQITNKKSQEYWLNEDGTQNNQKFCNISNPAAEIMNLKYNNVTFREQLVNLTSS